MSYGYVRAVHILLECILVVTEETAAYENKNTWRSTQL